MQKINFKIQALVAVLTLSMMGATYYSLYLGRNIATHYAPLADAAMEIELEATIAHLWFEEAISGDRTVKIESIFEHIEQANWYAHAMLNGGRNQKGHFVPLDDLNLRRQIKEVIKGLQSFKEIATERWDKRAQSGIGSDIDEQFDKIFLEFVLSADHVEMALQKALANEYEEFSRLKWLLILSVLMLGCLLGAVIHRYDRKRALDMLSLFDRQERLDITLSSIGDGVIATDRDGRITRMNIKACELTGWSEEEALGLDMATVFDIYNASTNEKVPNPVEQVLATGKMVELANHTVLLSKTGERFQISDSAAPIRYQDGDSSIFGVILVFQNVTRQYHLREELRKSALFLDNLMNSIPSAVYVQQVEMGPNPKFSLSYISKAIERFSGERVEVWLQSPDYLASKVHPNDRDRLQEAYLKAIASKKVVDCEYQLKHQQGSYFTVRDQITVMLDAQGKVMEIIGSFVDITEENQILEQNRLLGEVLEQSLNEIYIFDVETFKFKQVNRGARENTGYSSEEFAELTPVDIKPELSQFEFEKIIVPLLMGEKQRLTLETVHQRKDGSTYPVEIDLQIDRSGKFPLFIAIVDDITQRKRMEDEIYSFLQHLKLYREQTPLATIEWDVDSQVLDWNEAAEKMFGYTLAEVKGRNFIDIMLPDSAVVDAKEVWQNLIAQTGGVKSINENITKDGRTILCEWHNTALVNEAGQVIGAASIVLDVTSERAAKQALEQKELDQREILDTLSDGVITIDETGKILSFNHTAETLFGYSHDEAIDQNVSLLMPEPDKGRHDGYLQHFFEQRDKSALTDSLEVTGQHKSKALFPMQLRLRELPALANNRRRFIGSCQDLTRIKAQQAQLQRAQKMDALGKLVGGIAHDYNNMLGVVLGYTDLMSMKYSHVEGLQRYIDNIAQAGERGRKLTQRMLAFSKQESTQAQAISMNSVLEAGRELFSKSVTASIQLDYALCEMPCLIWVDQSELEDALLNLTINAQHAMPEGGTLTFIAETVHLSHSESELIGLSENDYLKLSVSDTGCGMEANVISKIFDPFFSTKGTGGSGLGLSQVYGFMERAGGMVRVYSQVGKGSEFTLYFPCYRGDVIAEVEQGMSESKAVQGDGQKILVVDDEPALRELAEEILTRAGYRVLTANGGDAALDVLAANQIDLVLSDVIMPNMSGYQLAQQIQKNYPAIKIQLASGFSDNKHREVGNELLHKKLLYKPYSSSKLLERIAGLLSERKK